MLMGKEHHELRGSAVMKTSVRARERALTDILEMTQQMLRCSDLQRSRQMAIGHMRRLFDASGAVFVGPERSVPLAPDDAVADGAVLDLPSVYGLYLHEDPGLPLLQRARRQRRAVVLTSDQYLDRGRLLRTRYYHEVMRPRAMYHAMAILLAADSTPHGVIAVYRSHEQPPFGAHDVAIATTAIPALTSALYSVGRLEARAGQVHQSIAVLDDRLDVLYRDASRPVWLTDWLRGRWHEAREFVSFAAHCRAQLESTRSVSEVVVPVPQPGLKDAHVAVELRRIEPPDRPRLVLLLRPAQSLQNNPVIGVLSPRESEVAELIAAGASHAQVAASLSVSVHTVAHHAAAVYRKTLAGNRKTLAARSAAGQPGRDTVAVLTHREREVTALVRAGSSNKEIASALRLSIATVSNHLQRIYRKLGVHDRVALIRRLSS
jgi:DNA-binding NarL/FixJ family response regulator